MLAHFPPDVITRGADAHPAAIAERALNALGDTHDTVAASLAAAGFTGQLESAHDCPIARYLLASDPRLVTAAVDGTAVYLHGPGKYVWVDLPDPVLGFVARFDLRRYPHLIDASLASHAADPGTTTGPEARW